MDIRLHDSIWLDALGCSWPLLTCCCGWYILSHDPTLVRSYFCHVFGEKHHRESKKRQTEGLGEWELGTKKNKYTTHKCSTMLCMMLKSGSFTVCTICFLLTSEWGGQVSLHLQQPPHLTKPGHSTKLLHRLTASYYIYNWNVKKLSIKLLGPC